MQSIGRAICLGFIRAPHLGDSLQPNSISQYLCRASFYPRKMGNDGRPIYFSAAAFFLPEILMRMEEATGIGNQISVDIKSPNNLIRVVQQQHRRV